MDTDGQPEARSEKLVDEAQRPSGVPDADAVAVGQDEREAFEQSANSMGYCIHRDESDKYKDYHRATTRFAREGWLSALAWAKGSGLLARGVLAEAHAEGYDSIDGYVAALKQSSATYFAERNSARDAWRRALAAGPEASEILARMIVLAPYTSFLGAYENEWRDLIERAGFSTLQPPSAASGNAPQSLGTDNRKG